MEDLIDLEKLAKDHKPIKDTSSPADLCFYWTMRSVYDCYRLKRLSNEDAKTAKRQAYMMHERFTVTLKNALSANVYREEAIRNMSCVASELHKTDNLEDKYRRVLKAITAVSGENVTESVEVKWLESIREKNDTGKGEVRD